MPFKLKPLFSRNMRNDLRAKDEAPENLCVRPEADPRN